MERAVVRPPGTMALPFDTLRSRTASTVAPGAIWLRGWLTLDEQRALIERCRAFLDGPAGGYVPTVRGGGKMHVRMTCLGRHWNAMTYTYEATRADHDGPPVEAVPAEWVALRLAAAADAGFEMRARHLLDQLVRRRWPHGDASGQGREPCVDRGRRSGRVGVARRHRPLSVRRRAAPRSGGVVHLESGDAFVFGGPRASAITA